MPIRNALVPHTHTHTLKIGTITSMIPGKKNSTSTKHTQMKGTKLLTPGTNVQKQQFCKRYVVLSRKNKHPVPVKSINTTCTRLLLK